MNTGNIVRTADGKKRIKYMRLEIKQMNLLNVPQGYYLAHCICADFNMGAGVARVIDDAFNMEEKLAKFYPDDSDYLVGKALLVDNVFNLTTKLNRYEKTTYETLEKALRDMKEDIQDLEIRKLAIPKIGCGMDRLVWEHVEELITTVFEDMDIEILVCEI